MARYWYQRNLRFLQTVLREIDIINYDPAGVAAYMARVNANVLVVNGGGVIDFFKNPLEMANLNRFMGEEILPGLCGELHGRGMRVMVRVDFRGVEARRYHLHPDWFARDQDGGVKEGISGNARLVRPCYNSPYTGDYAEAFIDYLLSTYPLDGIWENALGFDNSPCYCKRCRDLYREETGKEIPLISGSPGSSGSSGSSGGGRGDEGAALDTAEFAEYRVWKARRADAHIERMRRAVKKHGEDKAFCAEIFDLYNRGFSRNTGIDHGNAKKSFDFIVSCVFLDAAHDPSQNRVYDIINNAATTVRFSRALDPAKQPVIVTGNNGTRWRYCADPLLETRLWMWEIASVGGGIWNCYFNGQHPAAAADRRGAYNEQDVFTYLADNAGRISDTVPAADLGIYYSGVTKDKLIRGDEGQDEFGVYIRGLERVLLEHHIQYGFLPDGDFGPEKLRGLKALALPNAACIPDAHLEIIRRFVAEGGGLVASKNTSLFDGEGKPRGDFGLADLLGVSYTGVTLDTGNDSYQLIREKDNPVFKGLGDTDLLMNGGATVLAALVNQDYRAAATYVPRIPNQPPEYAWIPEMKTGYPTIVTGVYGKGRVVYFANGIEGLAFTNGHEDYTELYKNALDYVIGGPYLVEVRAPRSVHVNVIRDREDENRLVLALVNTTGTSQRPIKELVPAAAEILVPLGGRELAGRAVLWGEGVSIEAAADAVRIAVPVLKEFAALELRLRPKGAPR
ncbi:MAG: hypothetical protein LBH51_07910 [Treponema sp.]|jgi:uncharacterized membrane protein|nr:hypothetical protein [Treponema sp.]